MSGTKSHLPRLILAKIRTDGFLNVLRRALRVLSCSFTRLIRDSYSQYGEDLVLDKLTGHSKTGVFIDVGAYHPQSKSNSYRFSRRGWTCINVEPSPANFQGFVTVRPRDTNLLCGVSDHCGVMAFYEFDEPTRGTFSRKESEINAQNGYKHLATREIPVVTLQHLFDTHAPQGVDILSVDTEGHEMEVLNGNDWSRCRPKVLCIESYDADERTLKRNRNVEVFERLAAVGYKLVYDNGTNTIWTDAQSA